MTSIGGVNHMTLCCTPSQLPRVQNFYESILGLRLGARPRFDFPGAWLYANDNPIVHLAAVRREPTILSAADTPTGSKTLPGAASTTGAIDHIALRADGGVEEFRVRLKSLDVPFTEAPVPDFPLYQIFLTDPLGVKIELNFNLQP